MGVRLTDLPDALRDEGVEPVIVDGFQTRGFDFPDMPELHLVHWTAGPRTGKTPSLRTVTYGRPDLPYNLCTVLQSREGGTLPDKAYCVSSGKAVHAGEGRWMGISSGNTNGTGNEIEWSGPAEPFPGNRYETTIKIAAAHIRLQGTDARYVCNHKNYATPAGRKIDTNIDVVRLQIDVGLQFQAPAPPSTIPQEEEEMELPAKIVKGNGSSQWYATDGITKQWIRNREHAAVLISIGHGEAQSGTGDLSKASEIVPFTWPQLVVDSIRLVGTNA